MIPEPRGAGDDKGARDAATSAAHATAGAGMVMLAGVVVCLAVAPRPVVVTDGLSWFGVTSSTVVPFAVAMLATAALLLGSARELVPVPPLRPLGRALAACAALLPLLVATPFTLNPVVEAAHETVGSVLFVVQLLAAAWLARRTRDPAVALLLAVQLGAGVVCALSMPDLVAAMLQAQVVFQAAFTVATVRGTLLLGADAPTGPPALTETSAAGRVHRSR